MINDLKLRYKAAKPLKRIFFAWVISLIPLVVKYFDEEPLLEEDLSMAQNAKNVSQTTFEKFKKKKEELPRLESDFEKVERSLEEATRRLPPEFNIDGILEEMSLISAETKVQIETFDPLKPTPSTTAYRYARLPIKVSIRGDYASVLTFYDRLLHLELLTHMENVSLVIKSPKEKKEMILQNSELARKSAQIVSDFNLIIFRSLTKKEEEAIDAAIGVKAKKDENVRNEREKEAVSMGEANAEVKL